MPPGRLAVLFFSVIVAVPTLAVAAQPATAPDSSSRQQSSQQQWVAWLARRQNLQVQAKAILDAETAREKIPACADATTTYDLSVCYTRELSLTRANLSAFASLIRQLIAPAPAMPAPPTPAASPAPASGLTPPQLLAEFNHVEQLWSSYSTAACSAALHQFHQGTAGPSFAAECQLHLMRDHLRELNLIYGAELHL